MDATQREELLDRLTNYGIDKLFINLGFQKVSKSSTGIHCVCPFHSGADNPTAFHYSLKHHFGFCHTQCKKKMDIFQIVMQAKEILFPDAIDYLGDIVGIEFEYEQVYRPIYNGSVENKMFLNQIKKRKVEVKIPNYLDENVLLQFDNILHSDLRKDGFNEETREYFELGFARSGYLENRITIPIRCQNNELISVSGRTVIGDEKKYKILFGTEKSHTLYNINHAIEHIKKQGSVFIGEGFKFCWRLTQWGYLNCCSVMGSSISELQKTMLLKLGCHIFIIGDKDEAGDRLNQQVQKECGLYNDVSIVDLQKLKINRKSSVDDLTKEQFEYILKESL